VRVRVRVCLCGVRARVCVSMHAYMCAYVGVRVCARARVCHLHL